MNRKLLYVETVQSAHTTTFLSSIATAEYPEKSEMPEGVDTIKNIAYPLVDQ